MSKVWDMTKTEKVTPLFDDNSELENRVHKIEDKLDKILTLLSEYCPSCKCKNCKCNKSNA